MYCTVLYCAAPYCSILYCNVLYCTLLYYTVQYCTILYCTTLYCTVLHYTVLYCTALYCTPLHNTYSTALHITPQWGHVTLPGSEESIHLTPGHSVWSYCNYRSIRAPPPRSCGVWKWLSTIWMCWEISIFLPNKICIFPSTFWQVSIGG